MKLTKKLIISGLIASFIGGPLSAAAQGYDVVQRADRAAQIAAERAAEASQVHDSHTANQMAKGMLASFIGAGSILASTQVGEPGVSFEKAAITSGIFTAGSIALYLLPDIYESFRKNGRKMITIAGIGVLSIAVAALGYQYGHLAIPPIKYLASFWSSTGGSVVAPVASAAAAVATPVIEAVSAAPALVAPIVEQVAAALPAVASPVVQAVSTAPAIIAPVVEQAVSAAPEVLEQATKLNVAAGLLSYVKNGASALLYKAKDYTAGWTKYPPM